jgi:hypothetical protein
LKSRLSGGLYALRLELVQEIDGALRVGGIGGVDAEELQQSFDSARTEPLTDTAKPISK